MLVSDDLPYLQLLITLGEFGDDSPITGNRTVFNNRTMGEFKYRRFVEDQKANKMVGRPLRPEQLWTDEIRPLHSSNTILVAL